MEREKRVIKGWKKFPPESFHINRRWKKLFGKCFGLDKNILLSSTFCGFSFYFFGNYLSSKVSRDLSRRDKHLAKKNNSNWTRAEKEKDLCKINYVEKINEVYSETSLNGTNLNYKF